MELYSHFPLQRLRKALKIVKERFTWDYEEKPRVGQGLLALSWALHDRIRMLKLYFNNEMTGDVDDPEFSIAV
jgi:hypothetical protein